MAKRTQEGQYWIVRVGKRLTLARRFGDGWLGCEVRFGLLGKDDIEPLQHVDIDTAPVLEIEQRPE